LTLSCYQPSPYSIYFNTHKLNLSDVKQWSANTRLRPSAWSVKKLLLGHTEIRSDWSKRDWIDWHKEHTTAGAIDYHNPHRLVHLIAAKQAQISLNQCHDDLKVVVNLRVQNIHYFIEGWSAK